MPTPHDATTQHARAMRIVRSVLAACDPRAATANAARANGLTAADGRWVLAIGKAAIGMAEGLADHCGLPDHHLIVTVDGSTPDRLTNILRADHPVPNQRSLDAGRAVKRFIEEAKAANAPAITALISGGASALICEPIAGVDFADYRATVQAMLVSGWDIKPMNTVRRALDVLKGGGLAALAAGIPIDLLVISDVVGNTLHDVGSGPFVRSPTSAQDAHLLLTRAIKAYPEFGAVLDALSCRPRGDAPPPPRRAIVALDNSAAVAAAAAALATEGFNVVSERTELTAEADTVALSALQALRVLRAGDGLVWGGEWPIVGTAVETGGRCQFVADKLLKEVSSRGKVGGSGGSRGGVHVMTFATDGADGVAPPGHPVPAGVFLYPSMSSTPVDGPTVDDAGESYKEALDRNDDAPLIWWAEANSYHVLAHGDKHRRRGKPHAHIFTGPTGTNVNDLLIAWRV